MIRLIFRMHSLAAFLILSLMVFGEVTAVCKPTAYSASACQTICQHSLNCYYFTWNRVNKACFLKVSNFYQTLERFFNALLTPSPVTFKFNSNCQIFLFI